MKNRNWFWGALLVLGALLILAGQLGAFPFLGLHHINVWTIVLTVILAAWMVGAIGRRSAAGVLFPGAFLYMLYEKTFHLPHISFWALMGAALLASVGFSLLVRRRPPAPAAAGYIPQNAGAAPPPGGAPRYEGGVQAPPVQAAEAGDENNPYAKVSFGSVSKYVHADTLRSGQFYVSFGAMDVFFDGAELDAGGAEVFVDCNFGTLKIYVPRHWQVVSQVRASLGAADNLTAPPAPGAPGPQLVVKGYVSFGSVEIQYI